MAGVACDIVLATPAITVNSPSLNGSVVRSRIGMVRHIWTMEGPAVTAFSIGFVSGLTTESRSTIKSFLVYAMSVLKYTEPTRKLLRLQTNELRELSTLIIAPSIRGEASQRSANCHSRLETMLPSSFKC